MMPGREKSAHLCAAALGLLVAVAGCRSGREAESGSVPASEIFPPLHHYGSGTRLTEEVVRKWAATRSDERIEGLLEELGDPADATTVEEAKLVMRRAAAADRLDRIVRAHGFADAAEWAQVRARVLAASPEAMVGLLRANGTAAGDEELREVEAETTAEMRVMRELVGEVSEEEVAVLRELFEGGQSGM